MGPFPYAFGNFYNPYFNTLPVASPVVASKVITPIVATPNVAGVIPQARPYGPYDCVTAEAEAEATADPEAFYNSYYNPYFNYGFNGFYNGYYPHSYGAYPYGVNSLWNYAALGRGYATGFEGYPASTAPLPALPAPVAAPLPARFAAAPVSAPFAAPLLAAPAPVVKTVEIPEPEVKTIHISAPVVNAVPATPFPVFRGAAAPLVHAPVVHAPVVRQPVVTPIVKKVSKPVTYTHLGAHPIQPTTVFEETQAVVGHNIF